MKKVVIAMHWIIRLGEAMLLTGVLLIAGLYMAMHTRSGMEWAAGKVREVSGGIVEIQSLSGRLPFRLQAKKIMLHDYQTNAWLVVEDVTIRPSPAALLNRELILRSMHAGKVEWIALPSFHRASAGGHSGERKPVAWPAWKLRLDQLDVDEAVIHPAITREPVHGSLQGSSVWDIGKVNVEAEIAAKAVIPGKLDAGLDIDFVFRDYTLIFPEVTLRREGDVASVSGAYHPESAMVGLTGRVQVIDFGAYASWLGEGWRGGGQTTWSLQHAQRGAPWRFAGQSTINHAGYHFINAHGLEGKFDFTWLAGTNHYKTLAVDLASGPVIAGESTITFDQPVTYRQSNSTARLDVPAVSLADLHMRLGASADARQLSLRADVSHPKLRYGVIEANAARPPDAGFLPVQMDMDKGLNGRLRLAGQPGDILQGIMRRPSSLRGEVMADLSIHRFPVDTALDGSVEWRDGQYRNVATGTLIDQIAVRLLGRKKRLVLDQATATDGGRGRLSAEGHLAFDQGWLPSWDIQLDATNASIFRLIRTELPLSGQITSTGNKESAVVRGEVFLEHFRFVIPRRLPPSIRPLTVTEINHPDPARNTPVESPRVDEPRIRKSQRPVQLDITMKTRDRFEVSGRGLQSEWGRGELTLAGTSDEPSLSGSVRIVQGYAMLFGRRFTIDQGRLTFPGPLPPQPQLNITASTRISDVMASLVVGGTAGRPLIKLTSDPLLEESEIMSMILFGKLAENMTPWQAVALASGLRLLSGADDDVVAVLDAGQTLLQVDQINIKQDDEGEGLASVTVGKHVGPFIYLEGEKGFGTAEDIVKVTVELPRRFVLQTETSPRIREGISLFWRRDY